MFVIGTAGHVDHGKSTLVRALTGINPDRLREEQEREMTIDLGFAWLTLPSGRDVSVVDVPGHEDFVKNMLAGVGGIDVAILVVAADESVMPQTREHIAILDLLEIPSGVVALTKSDLVQDQEWLDLVQEEVREELRGTTLESVNIIPVSATTGQGLNVLLLEIDRLLDTSQPRRDLGRPRLPIDRVFTISGFGTIVTGTLIDGRLAVGDEVAILPGDLRARIRGLQTHRTKQKEVLPGTRAAVNLSGVAVEDLYRGQVLVQPGSFDSTTLLDARLRYLPSVAWPLKHNAPVEFYTGAARSEAYVRLLDAEELQPGQEGWVQFRLAEPVVVARGDHYIMRLPSPSVTLGGGQIVQPHPGRRHRRFRRELIERLESLWHGSPGDLLLQILAMERALGLRELVTRSKLTADEAMQALRALLERDQVLLLGGPLPEIFSLDRSSVAVLSREGWNSLLSEVRRIVGPYHAQYPLRIGMPREELKSRLRIVGTLGNQILDRAAEDGHITTAGTAVALPEHRALLSDQQRHLVDRVLAEFRAAPYAPPSLAQVEDVLGPDVLQFLLESGQLVKVGESVVFDAQTHTDMEQGLLSYLKQHQQITVAQLRDLFGTSRKCALAFLEDLDSRRITKRMGDVRVLR